MHVSKPMREYESTPSSPMIIHCDATRREDGTAGIGYYATTHVGKIISYDNRTLGKDWGSVQAEIEAMKIPLHIVEHHCSAEHVKCVSDCEPAAEHHLPNDDDISDYDLSVTFEHVPRTENAMADLIASLSLGREQFPRWSVNYE